MTSGLSTSTLLGLGFVLVATAVVALSRLRRAPKATGLRADREDAATVIAGRYRLVGTLGRGASGTVHLARDLRSGAEVALKTLRLPPAVDDSPEAFEVRARFVREAGSAARLRHRDIVEVLDAGEADGLGYLAMERLAGTDLSAHIRTGTLLPLAAVLDTVARVALALDHAHRSGVVHRDVKPANILLDRGTGSVKVTDFGIASVADAERTRTGVLLGTPLYMAPEQFAGGRVDGRSDLYALGVVLHELLTGRLPFPAASMAERLRRIADDSPPPDPRDHRPDLPPALADIVASLLQKRPALRPPDGRTLAAALEEVARSLAPAPPPR